MGKPSKTRKAVRDTRSGQWAKKSAAKKRPATTVTETFASKPERDLQRAFAAYRVIFMKSAMATRGVPEIMRRLHEARVDLHRLILRAEAAKKARKAARK